jgi:predicted DNA-binding transcriptional regulator YafY
MDRASRLAELEQALRLRETATVDELAVALRVSRRTVLRDLATLRGRGVVIGSEPGPGGGVRLDGGRSRTVIELSLTEIVAVWLGARLAQGASQLPWGGAANSAMAKLLASVPAAKARDLRAICRRVIVGQAASSAIRAGVGTTPPELLRLFEEAFSTGVGLSFVYSDGRGNSSQRRAEPHGLLVEPPVWYILTRDVDKKVPRTFRMDRISRPRLAPEITFAPNLDVIREQLPASDRWRPLLGQWD